MAGLVFPWLRLGPHRPAIRAVWDLSLAGQPPPPLSLSPGVLLGACGRPPAPSDFPALPSPAFPSPWTTVPRPCLVQGRHWPLGLCHHSQGAPALGSTSLRFGSLPLVSLGSPSLVLGTPALIQAQIEPMTPWGPWGNPARCWGFPARRAPGTDSAWCLGPGPPTEHLSSCWGGKNSSRACLRGTGLGLGTLRGARLYSAQSLSAMA